MSVKFVNQVNGILASYFCIISNGIDNGVFADILKIIKTVPLFKSGDKKVLTN